MRDFEFREAHNYIKIGGYTIMPMFDSNSGKIIKDYSIEELKEIAKLMRSYSIIAISAAESGHTGGTMSIIDIATVLYFKIIKHDPKNPQWADRDRVFWSTGHKAPALYAALGLSGYFDIDNIILLRRLFSGFEGHPNRFKLPGIEASSGSLGQGLGIAVGSALSARLDNKNYKIYCLLGDGELEEGSVWEAAMSASHYKLDNLVAIVDRNYLQIDGLTSKVMEIEPLGLKWEAFGWKVFECNGHNIEEIVKTLTNAYFIKDKPVVIIAKTIKGKGITYAENVCGYHGISPKDGLTGKESLKIALDDIECSQIDKIKVDRLIKKVNTYQKEIDNRIENIVPKYSKNYFWNSEDSMRVEMEPTRMGFGRGIDKLGSDPRVVTLGADITDSIRMSSFYQNHPERKNRFFSMGIAEANMTVVAAGLAKEGKIPFIGSYGVFVTGRNWDQIRTTICYNNYNVKIVVAHGGISVGPDGATHQSLEDISNLYYLPNMKIVVPSDSIESEKATVSIKEIYGPASIRLAREATPIITKKDTPFIFGKANIIRYRKQRPNFIDAYDIFPSTSYENEKENISIITCGPIVAEALRAAYIMKEEFGIETRVVNMHTIKPIDVDAVLNAYSNTKVVITAEEHQIGGFGNIIAGIISKYKKFADPYILDMVGINDRFGESGQPWQLMKLFGLTAEFIAKKSKELLNRINIIL